MTEVEFIKILSEKVKTGQETANFIVKGRRSSKGYKKLFGIKGEQVVECDAGILCAFPAKELLDAVVKSLPKLTLKGE